ncbi:MAG TPA: OmpA family protein [Sphingopyxis sp.]|nr:OmpA family protein [Sphingopyxis sp.]HMP45429.1 OmpA family protein [Sphingopyxis sp.]HMQ20805.1 OmpA family protein [Sphingopyxis sp.]
MALALLAMPAALAAQQARSPEQLLCDLQGICGEDAALMVAMAKGEIAPDQHVVRDLAARSFRRIDGNGDARQTSARPPLSKAGKASRPPVAQPSKPREYVAPRREAIDGAGKSDHAVPLPAGVTGRGELVLTFALNSAALTSESITQIENFALVMRAPSMVEKHVLIEGHTDASGSADYNRDLSRRRAETVVAALVDRGIDARLLKAEGFGFDRPIAGLQAQHPANRRVEAVLVQ